MTVRVALLGCGIVGSQVVRLLGEQAADLAARVGAPLELAGVAVRRPQRHSDIPAHLLTTDAETLVTRDDIDVVVEVIGGIEPARSLLLDALKAGKPVVTANKELIATHGLALFETAERVGVDILFEASVGGGIPLIRPLRESLAGDRIRRVMGIVNGTTNFILTEMAHGSSYAEALADAQRRGFAEADPSDDVSGRDAAAKMAILARLAFGTPVHLNDVRYEGIEHLRGDDLEYARELGLGLKLIGTAERRDGGVSVRVHPTFLYGGHPLASVAGPFNAVTVESEAITEITISGPGAGGRQTASAVLGDVVSVMTGGARPPAPPLQLPLVEDVQSAFYVHLEMADRPGVLSAVTQVLGDHAVSIKSVVQRGLGENARLVMVTHQVLESRLRAALARVGQFDFMRSEPRAIRVIEEEFV